VIRISKSNIPASDISSLYLTVVCATQNIYVSIAGIKWQVDELVAFLSVVDAVIVTRLVIMTKHFGTYLQKCLCVLYDCLVHLVIENSQFIFIQVNTNFLVPGSHCVEQDTVSFRIEYMSINIEIISKITQ
jgi:hypothetical protein